MPLKVNVEVLPGSGLRPVLAEALQISRKLDVIVGLKFNGIELDVHPTSEPEELCEFWEKENKRRATITSQW